MNNLISVLNKRLQFTLLYLPSRVLRIEGKEIVELTEDEFMSEEFQERIEEFFIIPAEKIDTVAIYRQENTELIEMVETPSLSVDKKVKSKSQASGKI